MSHRIVIVDPATRYDRETYGINFTSRQVHKIEGAKHNPRSSFTIKVWNNTVRPNLDPTERWTDFGKRGGPGRYVGPDGIGTDNLVTVTTSPEVVVIAKVKLDGPTRGDALAIGEVVTLQTEEGYLIGTFKIDQKPLHDPHLVEYECDGCDLDPWAAPKHYGTCPLAD